VFPWHKEFIEIGFFGDDNIIGKHIFFSFGGSA
jgi:hypothetical protein